MKHLLQRVFLILLSMEAFLSAHSQESLTSFNPPDTTPQIFAPGIVSVEDRFEFGCTLSKDGTDFYFGVDPIFDSRTPGIHKIWLMQFANGEWKEPELFLNDPDFTSNDPMLSPDESRLYFISNRPLSGTEKKDIDIWFVEKGDNGWSNPQNAGPTINSSANEYFISFAQDGSMYFASGIRAEENTNNFDIYRSQWNGTAFETPMALPATINTKYYEGDVYVAPDESYLIFASARRGGMGMGDLYISFNSEGEWSQAQNMGEPVNDPGHQFCPFISPDGKFLFFTSNKEIYWVSTEILKRYQ